MGDATSGAIGMKGKKYLVSFDVLGFEKLAEEIGKKTDADVTDLRENFRRIIRTKLDVIERKGWLLSKPHEGGDDWTILVDSFKKAAKSICEVLEHRTLYPQVCPTIPCKLP